MFYPLYDVVSKTYDVFVRVVISTRKEEKLLIHGNILQYFRVLEVVGSSPIFDRLYVTFYTL